MLLPCLYCIVLLRCMLYEANSITLALGEGGGGGGVAGLNRILSPAETMGFHCILETITTTCAIHQESET